MRALYELAEGADRPDAAFSRAEVRSRKGVAAPAALLARLQRDGLLALASAECWALTPAGLGTAQLLVRERRLWALFLMHEGELGGAPLDRDGLALSGPEAAELRPALERLFRSHGLEPALARSAPQAPGRRAESVHSLEIILIGALVAGWAGLVGCFLVLRRLALLGDAISQSVLPGIAIAFLLSGTRSVPAMVLGAGALGLVTTFLVQALHRAAVQEDAGIGVTFTSLFAIGVVLISVFAGQVDLDLESPAAAATPLKWQLVM